VTGPFDGLAVSASAHVTNFTINEVRFDQALLEASLSKDVVSSYRLKLTREDQTFELKGTDFDIVTKHAASVSGELLNASVVDLWTMVVTSPYMASENAKPIRDAVQRFPRLNGGEIDGSFSISGYFAVPGGAPEKSAIIDNLMGSVKLVTSDVEFDSRRIESMSFDAALANGAVMLNEARVVAGDTFAALMPLTPGEPVYEKGNLALELVTANLDLARLQPWLGENTPIGNATANFTVRGDPMRPEVRGSIEVVNPGLHGARFDNLRISQIVVGADRVDISDVILSTGGHQAVAQGYLPWDWSTLNVPRNKPFEFTAGLLNEDLALLNAFSPIVQPAPLTSGALVAEVKVSGTVADPTLTGAIKVENGTLALRGFLCSFTDVDVDISFDHKNVLFNRFSAQSTAGGTVFIESGGKITLAGKNDGYGAIDLVLRTGGLVIQQEDVFGLQEKLRAQIDAGIAVGGTVLAPLIADAPVPGYEPGVTISNADLEFAIPEKKAPSPPLRLPVNPKFLDLGLTIGSNVHVRPPQMDLLVEGGGNISRELGKDLYVSLGVTVKEGSINLFASRLRIEPGAEMVLRYQEPNLPEFMLTDFKAITSVTTAGPLGKRERYKVTIAASGNVMNLSEKNFTFTSEPEGLTKEQILAALGHVQGLLNTAQGDFQREFANALKGVATSALLMPVERLFTERLGFEEFAIESGQFAPLSLYLSRKLFGDFYLSFYQRLQATASVQDTSWQFSFGYRFKRFYLISVGIDDQQTTSGEISFTKAISL
ncbi:MAG: translocation/assembly module TamB, partial [Armatimonadetes bacterium]|nr:translocation/assembly module TamB [Armatimonadota bacterium]